MRPCATDLAPLNLDEFGNAPPDSDLLTCGSTDHSDLVYTGSAHDGTQDPGPPPPQCDDGSATTGDAGWGYRLDTNNFWSLGCSSSAGGVCHLQAPIYCFQQ